MLIDSLLTQYGPAWCINRALYSAKLKMLRSFPKTELWFEKAADVCRIDLFDFDCRALADFLSQLSDNEKDRIVKSADDACRGRILGFSSVVLDYGHPINWQLSPLTGKECSVNRKWFAIPDFDSERGDVKVIWEASRFSHFYSLCRAYLLTGDMKYPRAFSEQLGGWLHDNPYSYGANYKCGQECSLRMINTLAAYGVFSKLGVLSDSDRDNVAELVSRCYRRVRSNFFYAYRCIKNNHTISELCGLIFGSWCCGESAVLSDSLQKIYGVLTEQFFKDGGYRQYSFNYQRLALQLVECLYKTADRTGFSPAPALRERISASALLMWQCQLDDGLMPNYGSNDGALIFPVTSCGYRDYRPVVNTVFALTAGCTLCQEGPWSEELLWFGCGSLSEYPYKYVERISTAFPEAGIFALHNGDDFAIISLTDFRARPGHMDQLHLDLWHRGENILCDSGTGSYASELGARLASTSGHNTVLVGGKDQMHIKGKFLVYDWTKRGKYHFSDDRFSGTFISRAGYTHTRDVRRTEKGYAVTDTLKSDDGFCEILFHTPCDIELGEGNAVFSLGGKPVAVIRSAGDFSVSNCKRSLYYMQSEDIRCLCIKRLLPDGVVSNRVEIEFID